MARLIASASRACRPASIGGIARYYVVPNISITGELSGFKIPDSVSKQYKALTNVEISATYFGGGAPERFAIEGEPAGDTVRAEGAHLVADRDVGVRVGIAGAGVRRAPAG